MADSYSYDKVESAADFIKSKISESPDIGIICGSGLSKLGDNVEGGQIIKYHEIPHFANSTVQGHKGQLVFGTLGGKKVMCMQGRFHAYEGYEAWKVGFPVRVMKLLGVKTLIITNAAGGVNRSYNVGDFMIIKDHISFLSLAGFNPLRGPNDEKFGPRFPPMTNVYDKELRKLLRETSESLGFGDQTREGVYCNVGGPSFETIAEIKLMLNLGADAVGMSTAQEAIAAVHCGIRICACSLITNYCVADYDSTDAPNHEEVLETGKKRAGDMQKLVIEFLKKID